MQQLIERASTRSQISKNEKILTYAPWTTKSNLKGCCAIIKDWCFIALFIYVGLAADSIWLQWLLLWPIAFIQHVVGEVLTHEAAHYNLFRTRSLNNKLDFLFSRPFFTKVRDYRKWHMPHHV